MLPEARGKIKCRKNICGSNIIVASISILNGGSKLLLCLLIKAWRVLLNKPIDDSGGESKGLVVGSVWIRKYLEEVIEIRRKYGIS